MVQTYGVVDTPSSRGGQESLLHSAVGESDALLGADATPRKPLKDGHATLQSSVGNLANTIIGSGTSQSDDSFSVR